MPPHKPKKVVTTTHFSEQDIEARVAAAVEKALAGQVKEKIAEFEAFTEEQLAAQKLATVDEFCESRRKLGKILPAQLDPTNRFNIRDRLLRADARRKVHKFKENGKTVELSELEYQMREIDAMPAFKFGEKVGQSSSKATAEDAEIAEVEAHYEEFAEAFHKTGTTKQKLVEGFKAEKKHNPSLTAKVYLRK